MMSNTEPAIGLISVLPALITISIALTTRRIFLGLGMGVIVGALVAHGGDPEASLFAIVTYLSSAVLDQSHTIIIASSFLVAATANLLTQAGAVTALILHLGRLVRQRRSLMVTSWLSGLVLFFDDYANCLVIGNSFAPIYDRCRVSREKLAYIVDSTAAPIASISVISTWIGYELDLISKALQNLSISDSAFSIFLQSIPYRFYSIFTLAFVAFIAFSGMDFGPMKRAELRAARQPKVKVLPEESLPNQKLTWLATTAIALMVLVTLCTLIIDGYSRTFEFTRQTSLPQIISAADPLRAMLAGSGSAFGVTIILSLKIHALSCRSVIRAARSGFRSVLGALVVLYLAWTLGHALEGAGTSNYLSSLLETEVPAWILPSLSFLLAAGISLSTGSSFGTMGILIPIILPLAVPLQREMGNFIFCASTASVLAGASLGDHMSPISDTTVLSAAGSGTSVVSHTHTQLPYALSVGGIALLAGYLPAGLGISPWILIPLGVACCLIVVRIFGKPLC